MSLAVIPRSLRFEGDALVLLDQRALPAREGTVRCTSAAEVAAAIRDMVVRGAPAIGLEAVYVDETRPRLQGARLTAWELARAGVPHTVIVDSLAATLMRQGRVDAVLVGADRIAANGDVANKVGTYALAVACAHHGVPLIVVAPTTTIDPDCPDGDSIPIEERDAAEVLADAPDGTAVLNPAFDVTPAALVHAVITEKGVLALMFTTRPELLGRHGMVASTHWLASATGMAILERGGNAADAAVAAGFVLQVVEPHLNGLGGEVPILVAGSDDALPDVICGQGPAPALATITGFRQLGLDAIPGSGFLAACIPGAFDAWMLLLRDRGTMEVADVLAPAIDYARNGYPLVPRIAQTITACAELFTQSWPTSAAVYLPDGRPPRANALFRNEALAQTYTRLAESARGEDRSARIDAARDAYYRGFVAEAIDAFVQRRPLLDGSGEAHTGLLRGDDMAAWHATVEAPVTLEHEGHLVCKAGPWSQAPVLLQQLALLDVLRIGEHAHNSAGWIHTIVEASKLAFADREAWYGDPEGFDVPLDGLLDPEYTRARARLIDADAASLELRPGAPGGRAPQLPPAVDVAVRAGLEALAGEPTLKDTCHLDVADAGGMMVSATPSGGWLQSSPVIPELGFCLGTRAQMFWLHDGLASSLRPGTRPRTTLSPTLCMRQGRPALSIGTPGGDQQDQWQLHVLLAHLHHGLDLQAAIDAPAFHSTHFPSSFDPRVGNPGELVAEARHDTAVLDDLLSRGHRVVVDGPWSLGRVSAVRRDADGLLHAAANPRGMQGYAVGR